MKQVVLVNPPLHFSRGIPHTLEVSAPHLGLLYIASYVQAHSREFQVHCMDVGPEGLTLARVRERIAALQPFAIGISMSTPQLQGGLEVARLLKEDMACGAAVFAGGAHVSADPDFIRRHPGLFDHAITGEGEKTFVDSLQDLLHGREIPLVRAGEPVMDLDSIPFPARHLVKREKYLRSEAFLVSRGCPYDCYFCSSPAMRKGVRFRSARNIVDEIARHSTRSKGSILFSDDTFTLKKSLVMELCGLLVERGLRLRWNCNARVDLVDDEMLCAMRRAGCDWVFLGVEAASERVRRDVVLKGGFSNQDIRRAVGLCKKNGLRVGAYFILGHPTETDAERHETRDMIFSYGFDGISLGLLLPFPGSRVYELAREEGVISTDIIDRFARKELGEGYGQAFPLYIPRGLDRGTLYREMREINRRFYLNFRTLWYRLKRDLTSWRDLQLDARQLFSIIARGGSSVRPFSSGRS